MVSSTAMMLQVITAQAAKKKVILTGESLILGSVIC